MTFEYRDELVTLWHSMPPEHQRQWARHTNHLWDREIPMFMPDLVIAPDGEPYLYRWYMIPLDRDAGPEDQMMFHIQVKSDPERPLHDHPWDNTSNILVGGYDEILDPEPVNQTDAGHKRYTNIPVTKAKATDRIYQSVTQFTATWRAPVITSRRAHHAHRLILPKGIPYAMTVFITGPKVKEWGFWYPDGWHHNKQHVADRDGKSVHVNREEM